MKFKTLFKYLPFLLGQFIPVGDKHRTIFIKLQTLVDIAYVPSLTGVMFDYFEEMYEDHMFLYTKLYPKIPNKPQKYFLVHFKTIVKENGPLHNWFCLKYELQNGVFKPPVQLSHVVCNFKNISKTLTTRNQYTTLAHAILGDNIRNEFNFIGELKKVVLQSVESPDIVALKIKLPLTTTVDICKHIDQYGVIYSMGNIVFISKKNFKF